MLILSIPKPLLKWLSCIHIIGTINQYIDIKFEQSVDLGVELTRVVCFFPNEQNSQIEKSCEIVYRLCQQKNMTFQMVGIRSSSNTVIIDLPIHLQSDGYCYVINASNGSFTVLVKDMSGECMLLHVQYHGIITMC